MKKKILALALAAAMLLAMGAACAEGYVLLHGSASVRTGPGLGYTLLAQLNAGSTVGYLQQSAYDNRGVLWYRVSIGSGAEGWVQSTYAELTDEAGFATYAAGANASGAGFDFITEEVAVSGDVNVRSGPGLDYAILNTMYAGETALYLGSTGVDERGVLWYRVEYEGQPGWVSSVYAALTGSEDYEPAVVEGVSGDSNVRTGPGLGYASVGTLYMGDCADYLGASSIDERGVAWYCIRFGGQTAWVSSRYTEINPAG